MRSLPDLFRQLSASLRMLLAFTVICGVAYPLVVLGVAQIPGLQGRADGSDRARPRPGGRLGHPRPVLHRREGQTARAVLPGRRPSADAATTRRPAVREQPGPGVDRRHAARPEDQGRHRHAEPADSGLRRSLAVGTLEHVNGARVRSARTTGSVRCWPCSTPAPATRAVTRVVSVNQACPAYAVRRDLRRVSTVGCATFGADYSPRPESSRSAVTRRPTRPCPPTRSPRAGPRASTRDISPAYAAIQEARIATARGITVAQVTAVVREYTSGRDLGFLGEPIVNVLKVNLALDRQLPRRTLDSDRAPRGTCVDDPRHRCGSTSAPPPGVGKTVAMLDEGRRRLDRGTDVVVAPSSRPTAARTRPGCSTGCPVVARRTVTHRGASFTELDLEAVLERRPAVALVDELAHTNVPGSGPHEQALAGHPRAARRRYRRDHHGERPAPRVAQRRRHRHHRGAAARDGARRRGAGRGAGRARRHGARGAAPTDGARQRLPARTHRRRAGQLLPCRQPDRPPRAGAALAGRLRRGGPAALPRPARHHRHLGDQGARRRRADRWARGRHTRPPGLAHRGPHRRR